MDKEKRVYEEMKSAKEIFEGNFKGWLGSFLSFTSQADAIVSAFSDWEPIMRDIEVYTKYKSNAYEILKYGGKKYIYMYEKECSSPKELTHLTQAILDHESVVNYFNMNFFDLEDPQIVLLSFIEGLKQSCSKIGCDVSEMIVRFSRIFFATQDLSMQRKYGPPKTRFVELYFKMIGNNVRTKPNKSLVLSETFFDKLTKEESETVRQHIKKDIKPETSDYVEVMKVLHHYEVKYAKNDSDAFLVEGKFSYVRSKKRKHIYLFNNETGDVLKIFDISIPVSEIISLSEQIVK